MKNYKPEQSFDEEVAKHDVEVCRGDEEVTVDFLEKRAAGGPVLELGIGTGRIALPLAERGVRVDGIDISSQMVERLRTRPGGRALSVTLGNFADAEAFGGVSENYRLIYVVFNTFFILLSQEDQVSCFENVASHLIPDGMFVIEAYSPAFLYRLPNNQYVETEGIETDEVRLDLLRHNGAEQMIEENHVTLSGDGLKFNPAVQRYAWPAELDLMAQITGLRLKERWGGFRGEPFTSSSENCVSVYGW